MIDDISESTMRVAARVGPSDIIHDKELTKQKTEMLREARPVENSEAGSQAELKKNFEEGDSKYLVDDKHIVFEKYDEKGNLVLRLPPNYKPVDERV
jgi:hypothetical protein